MFTTKANDKKINPITSSWNSDCRWAEGNGELCDRGYPQIIFM